uniref:Uncharacterized protein Vacuolar ATP synthase subunit G1 n=1 Tax=Rhizophora mucronata TaxID=61149 RepID=A0A2P2MJB0_RHIMU
MSLRKTNRQRKGKEREEEKAKRVVFVIALALSVFLPTFWFARDFLCTRNLISEI